MLKKEQAPEWLHRVIERNLGVFDGKTEVQRMQRIPPTASIPLDDRTRWFQILDVACVFVDMIGSTRLSAETSARVTAKAVQFFTATAVDIFSEMDAPYIDIKGDGVFALWNYDQVYRALASAVSVRTFVSQVFEAKVKGQDRPIESGVRVGIDRHAVLVRRLGLRRVDGRTDRQNEVWAGRPVNMAAKLAGRAAKNTILASDRFFQHITDDRAVLSCGCPNGDRSPLWKQVDLAGDENFDFDRAHQLDSFWCQLHGREFCTAVSGLDRPSASGGDT